MRDQETIAELEDIVNELVADKAELIRIAQAYEEEFVTQRLSPKTLSTSSGVLSRYSKALWPRAATRPPLSVSPG